MHREDHSSYASSDLLNVPVTPGWIRLHPRDQCMETAQAAVTPLSHTAQQVTGVSSLYV